MKPKTMVQAICDALKVALENDPRVILLGEDIGKNGGVFRATEGLWELFGEERVMDTPLAEAGIIGSSIGLAVGGFRPVAEVQFMGFIYPAMEQLVTHAARLRTRTQGRYPASMVVRVPYGGGIRAPELHSDSTESLFVHIPGLKVVTPSTPKDAKGLLLAAIEDPDPVLFLEPMQLYRSVKEEVPEGWYEVPIGQARKVTDGEDVTLIAWGTMVPVAKKAAEAAKKEGISCDLIDLRSLSPLDEETIIHSVKNTGRVVIVHEAPRTAGVGAELTALINEQAFLYLEAPVTRVTGYDVPVPMYALEDDFRPDVKRVYQSICQVVSY
ncbi:alpha-ketoacid dehydrogenase subunit beta [Thermoactinomyces sp. CICC 23799]|jgi:2-oxoisovalerate dehydrogenase E1 component beta subunit|uniref:alpha-ketoacid dehydrogenase subunit beta n=1 Tax=Thermoactinomyces sp. CICC 23799 TaxID=2767429 RepID=UPI0018DB4615|nr:alpha-ketoacid dehydrogenase subunit beta [Thermoactinomyces sp. CICC 23799]MBH8601736.1 alpha-ketoacid dehydrogenase subunit beta [Thermoactinomyces sp. CICC 23799]